MTLPCAHDAHRFTRAVLQGIDDDGVGCNIIFLSSFFFNVIGGGLCLQGRDYDGVAAMGYYIIIILLIYVHGSGLCLQGIDDDGVAAMGYVQLHGGSVSPEAALQAVQEMREGSAGGASLEVCH